jgi:hypothetical protein
VRVACVDEDREQRVFVWSFVRRRGGGVHGTKRERERESAQASTYRKSACQT